MMQVARLLLLFMAATIWPAAAQTWDISGNGMLNGTYYFREVFYIVGDNAGDFQRALALYNTVTFDGNGHYTMNAVLADSSSGSVTSGTISGGTYSIAASGYGFLSNPLSTGDFIYGLVSQSGIFVGSSTEAGFNDLFVAAPVSSPVATNSTFKGAYTIADVDLSGAVYPGVAYAMGSMFQLNPDGAGNLGTVNISGYVGLGGSTVYTQTSTAIKYAFSNGAANIAFPTSSSAILMSGQKYLYISPDGNFVFGGSPAGFDFFVGVRMGTGTPAFGGLYYQAGIDEDESNLASGYGLLDTYYGSLSANNGQIVGHQRQSDVFFTYPTGYTYGDSYSVKPDGTYTSGATKFAVGAGGAVRIGSGIGPYLGINVALAAPNPAGSGVYINPQGVVNGASFAPFTAGVSPGDLITIYGSNLASSPQFASTVPFPTTLGDVQVNINGLLAPIYYVTPGQIAVIVPYAASTSIASIQVFNSGVASNTVTSFINLTTPGVFTLPSGGLGYAAALHADYSLVTPQNPAQIGETVAVYLTGLGAVNPAIPDGSAGPASTLSNTTQTVTADISGISATVAYAGLAPQLAGLYQVNVTIPSGVTSGDNTLDISGPDSYSGEALIPIGTAASSSAASSESALPAISLKGAVPKKLPKGETPRRKRPLPCLALGTGCRARVPE
jgi:uncharacterized protein (TIGR03437 family)